MSTLPAIFASVAIVLTVAVSRGEAAETVTSSVNVTVQIASRTSLKVSTEIVRFDVLAPGAAATASVDFSAGARVPSGSDVMLTVEPLTRVHGPGGAADVETTIAFDGDGDGLAHGRLDRPGPSAAGRWRGSGLRRGRLCFTLRAHAAGTYVVPLRFVLSTP